jgi:hypothetical protein
MAGREIRQDCYALFSNVMARFAALSKNVDRDILWRFA